MNPYNPYAINGFNSIPSTGMFSQPMPLQSQAQSMAQQLQQPPMGLAGKFVNDFNEILANDIPANTPAIFAKNDRSEIQIREWGPTGPIVTSYKAVIDEPIVAKPAFDPRELLDPIFVRLSELEDKIDKLPKTTAPRTKKDGE